METILNINPINPPPHPPPPIIPQTHALHPPVPVPNHHIPAGLRISSVLAVEGIHIASQGEVAAVHRDKTSCLQRKILIRFSPFGFMRLECREEGADGVLVRIPFGWIMHFYVIGFSLFRRMVLHFFPGGFAVEFLVA